jgi:uncharacterized membrane protein
MRHLRNATQLLLGAALAYAGTTHLTTNRTEFQAQVPNWVPLSADFVETLIGVTKN